MLWSWLITLDTRLLATRSGLGPQKIRACTFTDHCCWRRFNDDPVNDVDIWDTDGAINIVTRYESHHAGIVEAQNLAHFNCLDLDQSMLNAEINAISREGKSVFEMYCPRSLNLKVIPLLQWTRLPSQKIQTKTGRVFEIMNVRKKAICRLADPIQEMQMLEGDKSVLAFFEANAKGEPSDTRAAIDYTKILTIWIELQMSLPRRLETVDPITSETPRDRLFLRVSMRPSES
ncbi:hypothetical protein MRB53_040911 [Persea americana]|nr:hypothetical protein MRB53_040911 [Persea americana]